LEVDLGAVLEAAAEGNAGADAEDGAGGWLHSQERCYGGGEDVAVEDAGVAEDVHQEGVGAVGAVELHPGPVGAGSGAAMGGVDFGEAAVPFGIGADGGIAGWVEVAVAGLVVAAEDNAGFVAGGLLVQEAAGGGEVLGAGVEIAAQERGRPRVLVLVVHNNYGWFL